MLPDKKTAKQESAAHVKSLRKAADAASVKAVAGPPSKALHEAARDAHREASRAGSSHYTRHGGGITFHDTNEHHRRSAMDHEREVVKFVEAERAEANRLAAQRAQDPKWQAARLGHQAESQESGAASYRHANIHHPGMTRSRAKELERGAARDALSLLDRAHALDPDGGYGARAQRLRMAHADVLSDASSADQTLADLTARAR